MFVLNAVRHKSSAILLVIGLFGAVFFVHDWAYISRRGLFSDPPNPKYVKSKMLYVAVELMFMILLALFGKLWNVPFLLIAFFIAMFWIVPNALNVLKATYFIIKRWSKYWPRSL